MSKLLRQLASSILTLPDAALPFALGMVFDDAFAIRPEMRTAMRDAVEQKFGALPMRASKSVQVNSWLAHLKLEASESGLTQSLAAGYLAGLEAQGLVPMAFKAAQWVYSLPSDAHGPSGSGATMH